MISESKGFVHMYVKLEDHVVKLTDAEWYGETILQFEHLEDARACYDHTCQVLQEAQDKLIAVGWPLTAEEALDVTA